MKSFWVLIIIASAFIHLVAHVGMKKAKTRLAFIWLMFVVIVLFYFPIWVLLKQSINLSLWFVIIASAFLKALYFLSAKNAYDSEDLSIVYPVMGGTAPILLLLGSFVILQENLTILGAIGIVLIAVGLWSINLKRFNQWRTILQKLKSPGLRWALVAGVCIASYTLVDQVGVQNLNPFLYVYINNLSIFLFLTPIIFITTGWVKIKEEFRFSKKMILLSGVTTLAAISLVLYVVSKGMPAAYASSLRQISIVISGVIGFLFLKEKYTFPRALGSVLVAVGVAIISVFG